jgi:hypothetical protein
MKNASVARKGLVAKKCAIRALSERSARRVWGYTPHCDGKRPQAIENKMVGVRPLRERVQKPLEAKELNDGNRQ